MPQIIIERIAAALRGGGLPPAPPARRVEGPLRFRDMIPFGESADVELLREITCQHRFGGYYGEAEVAGLSRPHFQPRPRKTSRPLAAPRTAPPPPGRKSLACSVAAVWKYYEREGLSSPGLVDLRFDEGGMHKFLEPLQKKVSYHYPLERPIENLFWDGGLSDLRGIPLCLPHFHFDEPSAGVVEAFLSGADAMGWVLDHMKDCNHLEDLPDEDKALIDEVGFDTLMECYGSFKGKKSIDFERLENHREEFFDPIESKYPQFQHWDPAVIEAEYPPEFYIFTPEDIDAAVAYAEAFYKMLDLFPAPWQFEENDEGVADTFVHEVCDIYRRKHRRKRIEWVSPNLPAPGKKLSEIFAEEQSS